MSVFDVNDIARVGAVSDVKPYMLPPGPEPEPEMPTVTITIAETGKVKVEVIRISNPVT
jgi:hypothetical protein